MVSYSEVNPKFAAVIQAHALDDLERMMGFRGGEHVGGHRHRDVVRLELLDGGRTRAFYLKREFRAQLKDGLVHLLRGRGLMTKARWEWRILHELKAAGIGCPEPVAFGQRGWLRQRGYLVLAAVPGQPLVNWLRDPRWRECRAYRLSLIDAVAESVARLHEAGFDHPDLYAKHVWIEPRGQRWRVFWLDFQRCRRYRRVPAGRRWRDLARLSASLPQQLASRADRLRFLDQYLRITGMKGRHREAVKAIWRQHQRLQRRRKVLEMQLAGQIDQRITGLQLANGSSIWVDPHYRNALQQIGLESFDAVMRGDVGTRMRALADRENWRLEIPNDSQGSSIAYLKRHRVRRLGYWCRSRMGLAEPVAAGWQEAQNIQRLACGGVASMQLIAAGQKLQRSGRLESFVLTEQVPDAVPLDDFLRRRFGQRLFESGDGPPEADPSEVRGGANRRDSVVDQLIVAVADLARRFHSLGYNHRDFYCCHILVRQPVAGQFRLHLIDLQRMQYRRRFRRRWIVKDLAQLAYSAPPQVIGATDRMRFFKRYFQVRRLEARHKRLARAILAKEARIARRGIPP